MGYHEIQQHLNTTDYQGPGGKSAIEESVDRQAFVAQAERTNERAWNRAETATEIGDQVWTCLHSDVEGDTTEVDELIAAVKSAAVHFDSRVLTPRIRAALEKLRRKVIVRQTERDEASFLFAEKRDRSRS